MMSDGIGLAEALLGLDGFRMLEVSEQVVTGWTARDLLVLQTKQNNDQLELQHRQLALLLGLALLVGWSVVSQQEKDRPQNQLATPAPPTPAGINSGAVPKDEVEQRS